VRTLASTPGSRPEGSWTPKPIRIPCIFVSNSLLPPCSFYMPVAAMLRVAS
jgi:hypothetical protein